MTVGVGEGTQTNSSNGNSSSGNSGSAGGFGGNSNTYGGASSAGGMRASSGLSNDDGTRPSKETPNQRGFGISDQQRQFVADGNIKGFWESRKVIGDPVANAGLDSLEPSGGPIDYLFGGTSINNRLQAYARVYTGSELDLNMVRADLAEAHIRYTDGDVLGVRGLLNPEQIAEYHHEVFREYGLPPTAFGGTPWFGYVEEADFTRFIWCRGCDW